MHIFFQTSKAAVIVAVSLFLAVVGTATSHAQQTPPSQPDSDTLPTITDPQKPAEPSSPLDLVMKDGIPEHAAKRAVLREDLYALLATAATAKEATNIANQIERVWLTSGSETVSVLLARSTVALKAKDEQLALTLLDSIVELAPDNAEAWNRRAFIHYSMKNYRAAVGDLRRALALDTNHFKALDGLASIFRQLGDDAKALAVYEQLRQIHPHWPGLDKSVEELKSKVQGRGI